MGWLPLQGYVVTLLGAFLLDRCLNRRFYVRIGPIDLDNNLLLQVLVSTSDGREEFLHYNISPHIPSTETSFNSVSLAARFLLDRAGMPSLTKGQIPTSPQKCVPFSRLWGRPTTAKNITFFMKGLLCALGALGHPSSGKSQIFWASFIT